jgi:hypothetical protein
VNANSITLTLGQLDEILANAGVAQGSSITGQWDVWSFRPYTSDSLKSSNGPRAMTLTRGIPVLSNFNLVSPLSGITITSSALNSSSINFSWSRSGKATTYKWKFGSPSLSNIRLSFTADNSGYDSTLVLGNNYLDGLLGSIGLNPGDSLTGEWSVWAYNGTDSAKALQNNSLTLRREKKGDVLILYDSTNSNCRISKDSVVTNLDLLQITHQLYNRKGSLATNSASFKGYKRVMLIGEGNTLMSAAIKDSLKSYLNSGTSSQKSKLIIFGEDVGFNLDRQASLLYDTLFSRYMCGFEYVAQRLPGPTQRGIVGVSINAGTADSSNGPSMDVLKRSSSVPSEETFNLYHYRSFNDSMNAIGRISETYNVAVFAIDPESLRPAFDSPAGSPVLRILEGALDFVDGITININPSITSAIPEDYLLYQNYPNPFNPVTKISYSIPKASFVTLKVYNVLGKEVTRLVNESKEAGYYDLNFDATNLGSGIYFYKIEAGSFIQTKRMLLIK